MAVGCAKYFARIAVKFKDDSNLDKQSPSLIEAVETKTKFSKCICGVVVGQPSFV